MERAPVPDPVKRPIVPPLVKNLELKIGLLLAFTVLLAGAFVFYTLHARGVFQSTQALYLTAPEAEGVTVGMPMTFSGFPIGEVKKMDLTEDGRVSIEIAIPKKDAKWLRQGSRFTLEKSLVGGAKIKAFTADLKDKPLEDGARRDLLTGDVTQEIPILVEKVKSILANVDAMTNPESSINRSLGNVATVTGRMTGEYGVLEGVLGGPDKAKQVVAALDKANSLLANLNGVSLKVDGILAKTDSQVFGPEGVMDQTRQSVAKVNAILGDVRESLKKADTILANAQSASADVAKITGNVREATTDMAQLRVEIDDSVRKVNHLINEINKKWPFARDVEIKTP
jgi:phospholipid/cholesterol/gamma-HCH transport system substrate-binding protein